MTVSPASIVWHILGYSAIPVIFVAGILGSLFVFLFALKVTGRGNDE